MVLTVKNMPPVYAACLILDEIIVQNYCFKGYYSCYAIKLVELNTDIQQVNHEY